MHQSMELNWRHLQKASKMKNYTHIARRRPQSSDCAGNWFQIFFPSKTSEMMPGPLGSSVRILYLKCIYKDIKNYAEFD
jgi:hypothetical protein